MTDEELIARLRSDHPDHLASAAADRIEALVKDKRWIVEERDRTFALMLARAERLEAALQALEKASSEVSRRGAETGPQWSKLTIAILKARAALKGADHE